MQRVKGADVQMDACVYPSRLSSTSPLTPLTPLFVYANLFYSFLSDFTLLPSTRQSVATLVSVFLLIGRDDEDEEDSKEKG